MCYYILPEAELTDSERLEGSENYEESENDRNFIDDSHDNDDDDDIDFYASVSKKINAGGDVGIPTKVITQNLRVESDFDDKNCLRLPMISIQKCLKTRMFPSNIVTSMSLIVTNGIIIKDLQVRNINLTRIHIFCCRFNFRLGFFLRVIRMPMGLNT